MKEGNPVVMVEHPGRSQDALDRLNQIVRENRITAASFTDLGAVGKATGGFFRWERPVL
jgi:predicted DNA-binding protein with PD1-like motif